MQEIKLSASQQSSFWGTLSYKKISNVFSTAYQHLINVEQPSIVFHFFFLFSFIQGHCDHRSPSQRPQYKSATLLHVHIQTNILSHSRLQTIYNSQLTKFGHRCTMGCSCCSWREHGPRIRTVTFSLWAHGGPIKAVQQHITCMYHDINKLLARKIIYVALVPNLEWSVSF